MLDERQLELMASRIYERINAVNTYYLETIGKRYGELGRLSLDDKERLLRVVMWQGEDVKAIENKLLVASKKTLSEIKDILEIIAEDNLIHSKPLYEKQGVKFEPLAKNIMMKEFIEDIVKTTQGEITNLTKTTAIEKIYKEALNNAVTVANLGLENYNTAIESACREIAERGVYYTEFKTGYKRRLDSSIRQNVLWGMKKANLGIAERIGKQIDNDGWEISYHANPRPSHRVMGGQQYTLEEFASAGIQAKLDEFNCLHYKYPILIGISEPNYSKEELTELKNLDNKKIMIDGESMDRYEASQIQRRLETEIRKKSELLIIAKESKNKGLELKTKGDLSKLKGQYKKISREAQLPVKTERFTVYK